MNKLQVDIWSDVMCPFCYIGKRKFEDALARFPQKDSVQINWHSFQLDPTLNASDGLTINEYLSTRKGVSPQQAAQMNAHVTQLAAQVGLDYKLDTSVLANSFDAHRLSHMAAEKGLGDAMEERIFRAYFTESKDVGDADTLAALGADIGLDADEVRQMLASDRYADTVRKDIRTAQEYGINGVPFFVLDNKYAVSGAQAPEAFLGALTQAWGEMAPANTLVSVAEGDACAVDGSNC